MRRSGGRREAECLAFATYVRDELRHLPVDLVPGEVEFGRQQFPDPVRDGGGRPGVEDPCRDAARQWSGGMDVFTWTR